MISLVVRVRANPGREADYAQYSKEFGANVEANREGCLMFRTYRTDDPLEFVTIEHFKDQAALKAHQAAADTKAALDRLKGIVDGDIDVQVYTQPV
ncbi:MAG: putative quinol monooxygenase [Pseudomonadales bacterium]